MKKKFMPFMKKVCKVVNVLKEEEQAPYTQSYNFALKNMRIKEIEEVEIETNGDICRSLNVYFNNEAGERFVFKDRNVRNRDFYNKGDIGTLTLNNLTKKVTRIDESGNVCIVEKTAITIYDWLPEIRRCS